jgi:hypothetical protein
MTDQVIRKGMAAPERSHIDDDLADVELVIRRARAGDLTENEAFEDIERIVRRRDPIDIYQKSWG